MKLQEISKTEYDISDELIALNAERFIREMQEEAASIMAPCFVLKEGTKKYEVDQEILEERIRDLLKAGARKFGGFFKKLKGASDEVIQKAAADVQSRMAASGREGIMSKIQAFAKKNAKFAKPAMIVAVIGASMLGMEPAAASEMMAGLDQMGGPELDQAMADYGLDPAGGEAAAGGVGDPTQAINALKTDIAREFVSAKLPDGSTIPKDAVLDAIRTGKFDGMSLDKYLARAVEFAEQRGLNPQELRRVINPEIQQGMMDALRGKV